MLKSVRWKTTLLILIFYEILDLNTCSSVICPTYCKCSVQHQLRHAECSAKQLVNIDLDLPRKVQWLDVSNNSISFLEDRCFQKAGMTQLIGIVMKYNSITHIGRDAFYGLHNLQHLDLEGNHLHQVHVEIFNNNPNLFTLVLSNNPLTHLTNEPFLDVPSLKNLDISGCRFGHLPNNTFDRLENLQNLNISRNHLILIDVHILQVMDHLQNLDLSWNPIKCDESFVQLLNELTQNSVDVIGSPCASKIMENMFEKLVMLGDEFNETLEENSTEKIEAHTEENWLNDYDDFNYDMRSINGCSCSTDHNDVNINTNSSFFGTKNDCYESIIIPQIWVFIIGFQIGMATTLSGIFIWCLCDKIRSKNNIEKQRLITDVKNELKNNDNIFKA